MVPHVLLALSCYPLRNQAHRYVQCMALVFVLEIANKIRTNMLEKFQYAGRIWHNLVAILIITTSMSLSLACLILHWGKSYRCVCPGTDKVFTPEPPVNVGGSLSGSHSEYEAFYRGSKIDLHILIFPLSSFSISV